MSKFCEKCGFELEETAKFCGHCGAAVKTVISPVVAPVKTQQPVPEKKTVSQTEKQGTVRNGQTGQTQMLPRKKSAQPVIFCVLLAVALVAVLLLLRSCEISGKQDRQAAAEEKETTQIEDDMVEDPQWSDWTDTLPENVSYDDYEVEEKTLYRSRIRETAASEKNSMVGWELYDTVYADGGFSPWSDWSDPKMSESADREVQTQTRYRYRDKETYAGSSSAMEGYTLEDVSYSWGSYGKWSDWSASPVTGGESRKVETKTQYRYRSVSSSTQYSAWSAWSEWWDSPISESDIQKVESRTVWAYYYFKCPNCGAHMYGWGIPCFTWAGGCGYANIPESAWVSVYKPVSWDDAGLSEFHGTGKYSTELDCQRLFKWNSGGSKTQYRYATRTKQQVNNYGSWSNWSDTVYSNSSSREVQSRTVYRYCDRPRVTTYYFYRWGDWSDWDTKKVSATSERQVEETTYYRYRDRIQTTTYYFQRWTDWSEYSEISATPSQSVEVETKTQYRYRLKG